MPTRREHVIATPAELTAACDEIARHEIVGFDTEFVGEDSYHPQLCLIQAATPSDLYVIDALSVGPLNPFWALLSQPQRITVVHAGREEIRICHHQSGQPPASLFDVQIAAGLAGYGYPLGHAVLVQEILKQRVAKGETLTDWRRRPLTREQLRYAFDDVRHLLALWRTLSDQLAQCGRSEWALEEFTLLIRRSLRDDPTLEPWRKLRGLGSLDRRKLALARAAYVWRDQQAERLNRPARQVLRDDLIAEIARRNPRTVQDVMLLRGMPRLEPESLLEALEAARQLPADQLPEPAEREADPPQLAMLADVLTAALADFCRRQDLSCSLIFNQADLKAVIRSRIAGDELPDCSLTRGWRAAFVLPTLLDLLDGRRGLRIADIHSKTPLEFPSKESP